MRNKAKVRDLWIRTRQKVIDPTNMKLLLQSWCVLLLISIIWIQTGLARSRRNPACNEEQQNKMNKEFQECLNKFTKEHHESTGKASSAEDYQVRTFWCKDLCRKMWTLIFKIGRKNFQKKGALNIFFFLYGCKISNR